MDSHKVEPQRDAPFVVDPTPSGKRVRRPVCDLILLSWNQLEELKPCLDSLFEATQTPCRLIIVDNASEPAVQAFLRTVQPHGAITDVVLIQNQVNEGFPLGMNRGLRAATAPFVCLLNNDLRLTPGWLEEMVHVLETHPEVGLVNPESNTFGHHPPRGMPLGDYAMRLRQFRGQYTEVGMCTGFCLLMKRALVERIGMLSEEVHRFFFEDEDFSMRAQQVGYRCAVAKAAYVYHTEHRSVRKVPEREAIFVRNKQWCETKWGRPLRVAWPRFAPLTVGSRELRQWLERLLHLARQRIYVYVYYPASFHLTVDVLFNSVGLIRHADIQWRAVPGPLVRWTTAGFILARQKKRFDLIVAPDEPWRKIIIQLSWLHRAQVISEGKEGPLIAQWRKCESVQQTADQPETRNE